MQLLKRLEKLEETLAPRSKPIVVFAMTAELLESEIQAVRATHGPDIPITGVCWQSESARSPKG